jgi:hypothetical protein
MIKATLFLIAFIFLTSCTKNLISENDFSEVSHNFDYSYPEKIVELPVSSVPIELIKILKEHYYWPGDILPDPLRCLIIDLNGDKLEEYFFLTPMGGSGGEDYLVASNIGGKWIVVHEFQGRFHLVPDKSGWSSIVGIYRGGCGYFKKSKYIYYNKKYVTKWEKEYNSQP